MKTRNLHGAIMNLVYDIAEADPVCEASFRYGHKVARHAAAELALAADKRIEELEKALKLAQSWLKWVSAEYHYDSPCSSLDVLEEINKILGEQQ